jgi:hypothetical protein
MEKPGKTGVKSGIGPKLSEFPQFFPQVWKTLGSNQTRMRSTGVATIRGSRRL